MMNQSKVNEAVACFNDGYNCSQAILSTYCEELGLDKKTALQIACGLGAGMGRRQETCGAVSGAYLLIGLKYGKFLKEDDSAKEKTYPLTIPPYLFVGRKPTAVLFGGERIEVKSWHEVYAVILGRCNQDPQRHDTLMYLRGKATGKCRVFLSDSPDGMTRPLRIDMDMYAETHYGAETLMHILVERILAPVQFDCSAIRLVITERGRKHG